MFLQAPYENELLFSCLARNFVHLGLQNQKLFLEMVYGDRHAIAVVDLPSHLRQLYKYAAKLWPIPANEVVVRHTLFPLYSPFIGEKRAKLLMEAMLGNSGVGIHAQVGVAASIVQPPHFLRYCPLCLDEMKKEHGEYFWNRIFQASGVEICPMHNCNILSSSQLFRPIDRHHYTASTPHNCNIAEPVVNKSQHLAMLAKQIEALITHPRGKIPTQRQWTHFYYELAKQEGYIKGSRVLHLDIASKLKTYWEISILKQFNLHQLDSEHSWLINIFRKHKKAFSYLQHIMVWQAFRKFGRPIEQIEGALQLPKQKLIQVKTDTGNASDKELTLRRNIWLRLRANHPSLGTRELRGVGDGARIYTWLYRHDKEWLVKNKPDKKAVICSHQVNWTARDKTTVKELLAIYCQAAENFEHCRLSRNWYLKQLNRSASIEHNLDKMPLCNAFFVRYVESIAEYQIRRITTRCAQGAKRGIHYRQWELERDCGLARPRLPDLTRAFLAWIEQQGYEQIYLQKNS